MKRLCFAILLLSFFTISVFSFTEMEGHMKKHANCFAVAAQGTPYAEGEMGQDFAAFHVGVWRTFVTSIFYDGAALMLLGAFCFVMLGKVLLSNHTNTRFFPIVFAARHYFWNIPKPPMRIFLRWLALHESSPLFA